LIRAVFLLQKAGVEEALGNVDADGAADAWQGGLRGNGNAAASSASLLMEVCVLPFHGV
jgi:hypothetical protein